MSNALVQYLVSSLSDVFSGNELRDISLWLAEELTGLSRTELLCCKDSTFSSKSQTDILKQADEYVSRLRKGEPLAYITGYTDWCSLRLEVNRSTLIPRPETAELVKWIISCPEHTDKGNGMVSVADWCAGSGCIALALKKECPCWKVQGYELSFEAVETANRNARLNNLDVLFSQADVFVSEPTDTDILVANPPYVLESECREMSSSVLDYEPRQALFVPDSDALVFYRALLERMKAKVYFFEINPLEKEALERLSHELALHIEFRQDFAGKTRFAKIF